VTLNVHRAVFGEKERRHALRSTSLRGEAATSLDSLASLTDRPSADPPPGVGPAHYLSGFPFREWYVLARTFPDPLATRGGMVRSLCLFVPLGELGHLHDLTALVSLLPVMGAPSSEWDAWEVPTPFDVVLPLEVREGASSDDDVSLPVRLGLATCLLEGSLPTVWVGTQSDFERACASLWAHLPASLRSRLRFGHSNASADLPNPPPHLVSSPALAAPRWSRGVARPVQPEAASRAAFLLSGSPKAAPLAAFLNLLPELVDFQKLKLADACLDLLDAFDRGKVEVALSAARLLKELAPEPERLSERKARLLDAMTAQLANGDAREALRFANFTADAFVGGPRLLGASLEGWCRAGLLVPGDGAQDLVVRAFQGEGVAWWKEAVVRALRGLMAEFGHLFQERLWTWWNRQPALVGYFVPWLPADADRKLFASAPAVLIRDIAEALDASLPGDMVRLRVAAWATLVDPSAALDRCASLPVRHEEAVGALRERLGDKAFLEAALRVGTEAALMEAGAALARTPALFVRLDPRVSAWRVAWLNASRLGAPLLDFVPEPASAVGLLVDAVVSGESVPTDLLLVVSRTPHASLLDHPRRSAAWEALPERARSGFLDVTAQALFRRWQKEPGGDVEAPLANVALEPRHLAAFLRSCTAGQANVLLGYARLLVRFNGNETQAVAVVQALRDHGLTLPNKDVEDFASFVRNRKMRGVAEAAFGAYEVRRTPTLYVLAEHTLDILPPLRKLRAVIWLQRPFAENDFFAALATTLTRLFPNGPLREGVWEDAGGSQADLWISGTAHELWRSALRAVRLGRVPLKRLINVALDRYPHDPELIELERLESNLRK